MTSSAALRPHLFEAVRSRYHAAACHVPSLAALCMSATFRASASALAFCTASRNWLYRGSVSVSS